VAARRFLWQSFSLRPSHAFFSDTLSRRRALFAQEADIE